MGFEGGKKEMRFCFSSVLPLSCEPFLLSTQPCSRTRLHYPVGVVSPQEDLRVKGYFRMTVSAISFQPVTESRDRCGVLTLHTPGFLVLSSLLPICANLRDIWTCLKDIWGCGLWAGAICTRCWGYHCSRRYHHRQDRPKSREWPVQSSPSMGVDTFNSAWCPYGFCGTALTFHEDFSKNWLLHSPVLVISHFVIFFPHWL